MPDPVVLLIGVIIMHILFGLFFWLGYIVGSKKC